MLKVKKRLMLIFMSMMLVLGLVCPVKAADEPTAKAAVALAVTPSVKSLETTGNVKFTITATNTGDLPLQDLTVILPGVRGTANVTTPTEEIQDGNNNGDYVLTPGESKTIQSDLTINESELDQPLTFVLNGLTYAYMPSPNFDGGQMPGGNGDVNTGNNTGDVTDDNDTDNTRAQAIATVTITKDQPMPGPVPNPNPNPDPNPTPTPTPTPAPTPVQSMQASVQFGQKVAAKGTQIPYTFHLNNNGNVALTNVQLFIDNTLVGTIDNMAAGSVQDVSKSYQLDTDVTLNPSVKYQYSGEHTITLDKVSLHASDPGIKVAAKVDNVKPKVKDKVPVVVTISNTGNEKLTQIKLYDYMQKRVKLSSDSLDPGKSMNVTIKEKFAQDTDLVYSVTSQSPSGNSIDNKTDVIQIRPADVSIHDDLNVKIIASQTVLEKPDTVTFDVIVTNKGDNDMTKVEVFAKELGEFGKADTLGAGESKSFRASCDVNESKDITVKVSAIDSHDKAIASTSTASIIVQQAHSNLPVILAIVLGITTAALAAVVTVFAVKAKKGKTENRK